MRSYGWKTMTTLLALVALTLPVRAAQAGATSARRDRK